MNQLKNFNKAKSAVVEYVFTKFIWLKMLFFKVNESRYKQCWIIPYFSIGQNLLKKILRKDDIINWGKVFDRSADQKYCNIPWLVNFKYRP